MTKVAVVVGAGGVLGRALINQFSASGYITAGLHRDRVIVNDEQLQLECDLQDAAKAKTVIEALAKKFSRIDVLVCNAAHLSIKHFSELTIEDFNTAWNVGVGSTIGAIQGALPAMLRQQRGTILLTGATASLRGSARFAALATTKFALRGLAQSLAREYQPQGLHIAHIVIDGILRGSASATRFQISDDRAIDPTDAAGVYGWLAEQPNSVWTHEIDIRPRQEKF